jgi:hypothetical protein
MIDLNVVPKMYVAGVPRTVPVAGVELTRENSTTS